LEDNLFLFRTDCAAGFSRVISPSTLTRIGTSTCPNQRYRRGFATLLVKFLSLEAV
jgi:hypothetical protein